MASLKKRGDTYFAQYYVGKTQKRINLYTDSFQIAKEQLRQLESALYLETDIPLPSRTPLNQIVKEFVDYLFTIKTDKNRPEDHFLAAARLWPSASFYIFSL